MVKKTDRWLTITVGIVTVVSIVGSAVFVVGQIAGKTDERLDSLEYEEIRHEIKIERQENEIVDIKVLLSKMNANLENNTLALNKLTNVVEELKK